ncbi:hypothetical protein [Streptomyces caeruleatus]|uniref:Capsid maturation protease n=1 Tax=Streptomyces caeruleatus TaxID=661399 RepID=A0A101TGU1_9ACTN|nr:hypothetical protein [Streptomyces caeruleatus]KUN92042.1 hypothetical protein AQJ67_41350 [Streptomyces caeruleatus]
MSPTPDAVAHMEARARLVEATGRAARSVWHDLDRDNIYTSWLGLLTRTVALVAAGQLAAARGAEPWLEGLLGADPEQPESGRLVPAALAGVDGGGRPLASVLMAPMWAALRLVTAGRPIAQAMFSGQALLDVIVQTAVADAGRVADQVAMVSRPAIKSYVRVVEAGACNRCIILGGVESSVSRAFQRHPKCKCSMDPVTADHRPTATSPEEIFDAMSPAERRKTFGQAGAKAIEDGADIAQVVNARRGMTSATVFGRRVQATSEGITSRGFAGSRLKNLQKVQGQRYRVSQTPRLMPEEIYRLADDRDHAVRLLTRHGFIA